MKEAELYDLFGERYGFGPWDIARLHPSEIRMYLEGMESREEKKQRQAKRNTSVSADQRRREQQALEKYA